MPRRACPHPPRSLLGTRSTRARDGLRAGRKHLGQHRRSQARPVYSRRAPNTGRPSRGLSASRSMRMKARTPSAGLVRSLAGMTISTPSWTARPIQTPPTLIVPVVWPAALRSTAVWKSTSTKGTTLAMNPGSRTSLTNDVRYGRLYSMTPPHWIRSGCSSLPFVGTIAPRLPVTANGRNRRSGSGRSPNPLPTKTLGRRVSNDSSPTIRSGLPLVPPTSQRNARAAIASRASLRHTSYLRPISRFSAALRLAPVVGSRRSQPVAMDTSKLGGSRFLISRSTSVTHPRGVSAVRGRRRRRKDGDTSSSTNGSLMTSVSENIRLPTTSWAEAVDAVAALPRSMRQVASHRRRHHVQPPTRLIFLLLHDRLFARRQQQAGDEWSTSAIPHRRPVAW